MTQIVQKLGKPPPDERKRLQDSRVKRIRKTIVTKFSGWGFRGKRREIIETSYLVGENDHDW